MLTTKKLTLQEYLAIPQDDNYCELVDGQAIPKMSPKRFHSRVTVALCSIFNKWIEDQGEIVMGVALIRRQRIGQTIISFGGELIKH